MRISVPKEVLVLAILATLSLVQGSSIIESSLTAALKKPAAEPGLGIRDGILAAFEEVNAASGVHGRKLDLTTNRRRQLRTR